MPVPCRWAFNQHFLSVSVLPVTPVPRLAGRTVASIYRSFPLRVLVSATRGQVTVTRLSAASCSVQPLPSSSSSSHVCHFLWCAVTDVECDSSGSRAVGIWTFVQVLLFSLSCIICCVRVFFLLVTRMFCCLWTGTYWGIASTSKMSSSSWVKVCGFLEIFLQLKIPKTKKNA